MRYLYLLPFALFACSSAELPKNVPAGERDPVTVEAKFAGSEVGAHEIAEFRFPEGSAELSKEALDRIDNAFGKAGPLAEVKVLAWPDRESAPVKGKSLPKADQDLATKRIEAIGRAIAPRTKGMKVRTHNMASSPSTLDRILQTSEYRVKDSLQASGVASGRKEGTSMAGKGLVMLVPK
jgi:hypothetical protein